MMTMRRNDAVIFLAEVDFSLVVRRRVAFM